MIGRQENKQAISRQELARFLCLVLLLFSFLPAAKALNFAVDNTGAGSFCIDHSGSGGNFVSLVAALAAANVAGGPHTVDICPGIAAYIAPAGALANANYAGLTIQGTTGVAANVTVNPTGGNEVFDLRRAGITLQHFTVFSGNGNDGIQMIANNIVISNVAVQSAGRNGILVFNSTGVTLSNVVINTSGREGILANAGSTGLVINSADGSKPATAVSATTRECIEIDAAGVDINDVTLTNCGQHGLLIDGANASIDNVSVDTTGNEGILLNGLAPLLNQDDSVNNTITISNTGREGIRTTNNADNAIIDNLVISNTTRECAEHQGDGNGVTVNFENYDLSNCGAEGLFMRSPDQLATTIKVDVTLNNRECMEVDGADSIVSDLDLDNCANTGLRFDGAGVSVSNADINTVGGFGLLVSGNDGVVNQVNIADANSTGIRIESARADLDDIDVNGTRVHGVQITQQDADITNLTLTNIGTYNGGNGGADGITVSNRRLNLTSVVINDARDYGIHYNTTTNNTNNAVNFNDVSVSDTGDDGIFVNRSTNNMVMDNITITNSGDHGLTLLLSRRATISNVMVDGSNRYGIYISRSRQNEIFDSTISNSSNFGMLIATNNNNTTDEARNNRIHDNIFIGNTGFGLRISDNGTAVNDNNRVYENCFFTAGGTNARDDENDVAAPVNDFDVGSRGNFWGTDGGGAGHSETCVDVLPPAGICDTTFALPGGAGSIDNFPLTTCSNLVFDHFNVTASITASTCTSTEITIEAVDISDIRIPFYSGLVKLNTLNVNGNWSELDHTGSLSASNPAVLTVTDTPGDDDGMAIYQFAGPADGGIVGLFLSNEHAETITVSAEDTLVAGSLSNSGNVTFFDNVFEVTPTTCTGSSCPGTASTEVVAGRDHTFHVRMLRRDSGPSPQCGVATTYNNNTQNLKAWIVRTGDDPGGVLPTLVEQTSALGDNSVPVGDNVTLDFMTTAGEADFTLVTTDVGDYEIFLRDDSNVFAGIDIDGSSGAADPVTVRPFGIALTAFDDDGVGLPSNPGGSAPGDTEFVSAGSSFHATLGAYLYAAGDDDGSGGGTANDGIPDGSNDISDNGTTPAFAWDTTFSVNKNTPTAGGAVTGTLNNASAGSGEFGGGSVAINDFQYMEVGSITIDPDVTDYLNLGINFTVANGLARQSEVVGRFSADHFEFSVDTAPVFSAGCNTFSYIDQAFDFTNPPELTARAYANGVTFPAATLQNYHDFGGGENFWLLNLATGVNDAYSSAGEPGPEVTFDDAAADYAPNLASDTGSNGVVQFTLNGPFAYVDRNALPYGPVAAFSPAIDLDFQVTDSDGATGTQSFNPVTFANPEQRWGTLVIGSNSGSELLALGIPLQTEYFDGTSFVLNSSDNCSSIAAADLALSSAVTSGSGPSIDITNAASCTGTGVATAAITNNPLSAGNADLSFTIAAPASACTGYADISLDLSTATGLNMEWLYFDWDDLDGLGDGPHDDDPAGRASFGVYQGPREFIYQREPWN